MRTKTTLLLYNSRLFGRNEQHSEFCYPKKKIKKNKTKVKGKARWSYNKMLIDWVRSGRTGKYLTVRTPWPRAKYFPVRPSHSANKHILRWYRAKCVFKSSFFFITRFTHRAEAFFYIHYVHFRPVSTTDILGKDPLRKEYGPHIFARVYYTYHEFWERRTHAFLTGLWFMV